MRINIFVCFIFTQAKESCETESKWYKDYSLRDFWNHYECDDVTITIPDASTWTNFRKTYEEIVGRENSSIGDVKNNFNALEIDYIVVDGGDGTALHTKQYIKKGAPIYNFKRSAQFQDG